MKKLSLIILSLITFSQTIMGKSNIVAVVSQVKGKVFYSHQGKTVQLKEGMHIANQGQIYTEIGSQISFNDYYDHIYQLSGSGHLVVHKNLIELKNGYFYVKSLSHDPVVGPFSVTTANAQVSYTTGEGIVSFDTYTGKTQMMTVKGKFHFSNILTTEAYTEVGEGKFSFIHNDQDHGAPRKPTPIGYSSFQKITGLFNRSILDAHVEEVTPVKANIVKREIASAPPVEEQAPTSFEQAITKVKKEDQGDVAPGKVTIIKAYDEKAIAQNEKSIMNFYQSKLTEMAKPAPVKKWKPAYGKKSSVKLNFYGMGKKSKGETYRVPASVKKTVIKEKPMARTPASIGDMAPEIKPSSFESSLVKEYKNQMRHDNEVNSLIQELKSVDMDYKKEY